MYITRSTCIVCVAFLLCRCSPWESWTPERTNNKAFLASGYGKVNRYYSGKNIDNILNNLRTSASLGVPIPREQMLAMREKIIYSQNIEKKRSEKTVQKYFLNYREVLFADKLEDSIANEKAQERDYFSISEYNRIVPKENIFKVRMLKSQGRLPMTESMSQDIKKYYKYIKELSEKNKLTQEGLEDIKNRFEKEKEITYNMKLEDQHVKQVTFLEKEINYIKQNAKTLESIRAERRYYQNN
ncbi:MAG: hypothetical protein JJW01_01385 [Alphaproteobacteria bacterium]|nr:hypothetical protein [Rickettsiales bacterium]